MRHVINFITLLVKFILYRCKCAGTIPVLNCTISEIRLYHDIELEIAKQNLRIEKHKHKWHPVYPLDLLMLENFI